MGAKSSASLEIDIATSNEQLVALGLVFAKHSESLRWDLVQRVLAQHRANEMSLDELVVARRSGRVVGAGWLQWLAGRVAMIWPPQLADIESPATAASILSRMEMLAECRPVQLLQAFVLPNDGCSGQRLVEAGFQDQSDLLIYKCERGRLVGEPPIQELNFEIYSVDQRDRLERLVEETYYESLDCPELTGVRDISDTVDGHCVHRQRAAGEFDPNKWFFVRNGNRDIGCLLLADHPQDNQIELVYMGLIPSARGNGWGKQIVEYSQWQARQCRRDTIVLGVDARNKYAICVYESAGFAISESRRVFLKFVGR